MDIYTGKMKRITVVVLSVAVAALVASLQPFFLGCLDFNAARMMSLPIAFVVLCFLIMHILQNWRLLVALFKSRKSYRVSRLAITTLMMVIGAIDIASGWISAVSGEERYILLPMWVWSWTFTILVAIHIYQHRDMFLFHWRKLTHRA